MKWEMLATELRQTRGAFDYFPAKWIFAGNCSAIHKNCARSVLSKDYVHLYKREVRNNGASKQKPVWIAFCKDVWLNL